MKVDVPTPPGGSPTQRVRRPVPDTIKLAVPMTALGGGLAVALGWAWNLDKNQAVDHQRVDDLKADMHHVLDKLDDMKDLILKQGH